MKKYTLIIVLILMVIFFIPFLPHKYIECRLDSDNGDKITFTACVYGTTIDNHKPIIFTYVKNINMIELIKLKFNEKFRLY